MKQTTDTVDIGDALLRGEDTANKEDLDAQIESIFPSGSGHDTGRAGGNQVEQAGKQPGTRQGSNDATPNPEEYPDSRSLDVSKENEAPLMVQLPKADNKASNILQNKAIVPIQAGPSKGGRTSVEAAGHRKNKCDCMRRSENRDARERQNGCAEFISRRNISYEDSDSNDDNPSNQQENDNWIQESMKYINTASFDTQVKPNERFKNYRDCFNKLTISQNVATMYPIVSVAISFDSKVAITITKRNEREYWIKMYSLTEYTQVFGEMIGGGSDQYIKVKEIAQNERGDKYALVYFDDGKFRLRTFDRSTRTKEQIDSNDVNINDILGIDDFTMVV